MESSRDDLYHYGRKGMKWYQHIFGETQSHAQYAKKNKGLGNLSDDELKSKRDRLRLENEYLEEKKKRAEKDKSKFSKEATRIALAAGERFITSYFQKLGEKMGSSYRSEQSKTSSKKDDKKKDDKKVTVSDIKKDKTTKEGKSKVEDVLKSEVYIVSPYRVKKK